MAKISLSNSPHDIWVVAHGAFEWMALEMTYGARSMADLMGFYVKVAVLGSELGSESANLISAGADKVYLFDHPALSWAAVEPRLKVLTDLFAAQSPEFVMLPAEPIDSGLAPRLAQRFSGSLISGCTSLRIDDLDRAFVGRREVWGGQYFEVVATSGPAPQFAIVLPGCFEPPYLDSSRYGETEVVGLDDSSLGVASEPSATDLSDPDAELVHRPEPPKSKLKNARRIVSVGRQVGDVKQAKWLANVWGAEFAGAREALDEGYIDESQVVGITGARVAPDLYIALGIRGDTQHAFGIQDARFVVAVHPDPDAPIFKQADVGIVGEPSLVAEELRKKVSWL